MPERVAVFTDSTAGIPPELAARWGVNVVQIQLRVGETVDDENRFDKLELLDALRSGWDVSTAPPDVGAFFWTYQAAVTAGATSIVSLHISSKLSATVEAAIEASQHINVPVYVLDSATSGMSMGFAAIAAARASAAGATVQRVVSAAEHRYTGSTELIYVDTLEYLRRGGRVGTAQAMVGTALSIKPLLTVKEGEVVPLTRGAGSRRAIAKLVDLAVAKADGRPVEVAAVQFGPDARVTEMAAQLRKRLPQAREILITEMSMTVGVHIGPGGLGITVSPLS
jgi:DegV family protein with EDD domain